MELPPLHKPEELHPGIWSLPIPMPGPLGFICVYALEAPGGLLLIDAGWDSPAALDALIHGLSAIGADLRSVRGILFTHGHRDHYGAMRLLRPQTSAWTALHQSDVTLATNRRRGNLESHHRIGRWLEMVGAAHPEQNAIVEAVVERERGRVEYPEPDRALSDGDIVDLVDGTLTVIHTPGHTAGHVSFLHEQAGLVFSGDHILSHTTPHVGVQIGSNLSPLDDYLCSLERIRWLEDVVALPAHEERVRAGHRASELVAHHRARLDEVRAAVAGSDEGETVWTIAERMTWWSPWRSYGPLDLYMALTEAFAHVIYLERRGELTRDARCRWRAGR